MKTLLSKHKTPRLKVRWWFHISSTKYVIPKAEIEDTYKQTGRCDFVLCENDLVMLEIKNYKINVNKAEIDKFYRDVDMKIIMM